MDNITTSDLKLINTLCSRTYSGRTLKSNSTLSEQERLRSIKKKLLTLIDYFAQKYNTAYGPFEISVSSGNPISLHNTFNNVWAGMFKGADNKQYAAQVSFVLNREEAYLDVGFYFGRASNKSFSPHERKRLEDQLKSLGISLYNTIKNNDLFRNRFECLNDFGFKTFSGDREISQSKWLELIRKHPQNCHIVAKVYPNDFHSIENSTIDFYISQIVFLMEGISPFDAKDKPIVIKPLTPEQRAKEAERLAEIGQRGELYVMICEKKKLENLKVSDSAYPKHVALDSTHYGYDIISLDENLSEILIEVKTTTRASDDPNSKCFFLSTNELQVFKENKSKYRLYRVYDIESKPTIEILNLEKLEIHPDGYLVKY